MYKVAVLISVYEASKYLDSKFASILNQTIFEDCTFLFINCQDRECESVKIEDFCSRHNNCKHICSTEYITIYEAWNNGIQISDSKYITNYNMDDQWHPEYLERCVEKLNAEESIALVYSRVLITDEPNQIFPNWRYRNRIPFGMYPEYTAGPCPVWRRSLHSKYGMFEDYFVISDAKQWEKYIAGGERFGLIDEDLVLYYLNKESLERRRDNNGVKLIDVDLEKMHKR